MKDKRPVFLPINPFKFPLPFVAFASILHRVSGVVLFGAFGYFLFMLQIALPSAEGFEEARVLLTQPLHQFVLFVCLTALAYHVVLGIKHLLLDFHLFDTMEGSKFATTVSAILFAVMLVSIAIWIWV